MSGQAIGSAEISRERIAVSKLRVLAAGAILNANA